MSAVVEDYIRLSMGKIKGVLQLNRTGKRSVAVNLVMVNKSTSERTVIPIRMTVQIDRGNDFLQLEYYSGKSRVVNTVALIALESNLRHNTWVYYFKCPILDIKCRNLYLDTNQFVSRKSLNLLYKQQAESRGKREKLWKPRKIAKLSNVIKITEKKRSKVYAGHCTINQEKGKKAKIMVKYLSRL